MAVLCRARPYVPAIHALAAGNDVDARDKRGHDSNKTLRAAEAGLPQLVDGALLNARGRIQSRIDQLQYALRGKVLDIEPQLVRLGLDVRILHGLRESVAQRAQALGGNAGRNRYRPVVD